MGLSKAEKKAARLAEEKALAEASASPIVGNSIVDDFLSEDEEKVIEAGLEVEKVVEDLASGKISIDEAQEKASHIVKDIDEESVNKLKNVPKKYWKFQTVGDN